MKFNLETFASALRATAQQAGSFECAVLGLSGGMDSIVLLHLLSELKKQSKLDFEFRAVHINHGLHAEAAAWQQHCEQVCAQLSIQLISVEVSIDNPKAIDPDSTAGIENAAREARYRVFEQQLKPAEALILAHHRDDQMETLLLRLMRGSGSRGLSGMPRTRAVGAGFLLRPLLDFDQQQLHQYARQHQLQWMQDPSNQDQRFDRNYCRHTVLPILEARWPGYRDSWSKTVTLAEEAEGLLQNLATLDLASIATSSKAVVQIDKLLLLSNARRRNVLRHWLAQLKLPELGWNRLHQLANEVLFASDSAALDANGFQLARYKGCLYALTTQEDKSAPVNAQNLAWDFLDSTDFERADAPLPPLLLPILLLPNNGSLTAQMKTGPGLAIANCAQLQVRYRQGGESCRLAGRPNKSLKKILQEHQIEPWLRNRIPLLYREDQLVCIPGIGVSEEYAAKSGEPGLIVQWLRPVLEVT
jgi:tRNA(Ile)-lysidine synthase